MAQTELLTIAAAASTDTALTIPAGAVLLSVTTYVVTTIPTAATYTVTLATLGTALNGTTPTAAGSSSSGQVGAGTRVTPSANAVRITPNLTPGAGTGQVRITAYYYTTTPATS